MNTPTPPAGKKDLALDAINRAVVAVHSQRDRWVRTSLSVRISMLERAMAGLASVAEQWAQATCEKRGLDPESPAGAEPWLTELVPTMRCFRLMRDRLRSLNRGDNPKVKTQPSGDRSIEVFPTDGIDKLLFRGMHADVWIAEGKPATVATGYREKRAGNFPSGQVTLVLGAGNVGSICPTDALSVLLSEESVVIIKTHPVNAYLAPFWKAALAPFIEEGFVDIVHGGPDVGAHLCNHELIDAIHITGSDKTYERIVFGTEENLKAGTPINDRPVTAELGCVTPVFVVPGRWSKEDIAYHARNIAAMVTNNASFNCVAAKAVVTATGWKQRDAFWEALRKELREAAPRKAYYPGAHDRYSTFLEHYPQAEVLGEKGTDVVPWTVIPRVPAQAGEYALSNEAFCGVVAQVDLDAEDAASFLDAIVPFANEVLWGTLSCSLVIHPKTAQREKAVFDQTIAGLNYGTIAVNIWPGVAFGVGSTPWGAAPGHPPDSISSGAGTVHNTHLVDNPQKTVLYAPFRIWPKPIWFCGHGNALKAAKQLFALEHTRSWWRLPRVAIPAAIG